MAENVQPDYDDFTQQILDQYNEMAQLAGALVQGVLQAQAFLMADYLIRGRLPDVNDGLAGEMLGCNQIGVGH